MWLWAYSVHSIVPSLSGSCFGLTTAATSARCASSLQSHRQSLLLRDQVTRSQAGAADSGTKL